MRQNMIFNVQMTGVQVRSECTDQYFIQIQHQSRSKTMSSKQIQQLQASGVAGFIARTFEFLNNEEYGKIAFWSPSGQEFFIKDVNKFQEVILPQYFRHSKINSFVRQLNMYGFHKSRTDKSKHVFSHPSFLRGRPDLLIAIKRKFKPKGEQKCEAALETPLKQVFDEEPIETNQKDGAQTGKQLTTIQQFSQSFNNPSFNTLFTKKKLSSIMNLNCSMNALPPTDLVGMDLDDGVEDSQDQASIADNIERNEQKQDWKTAFAFGPSYKFVNPSCFFQSM